MAYLHDLADTWNDAGTTFTALKMNVTDTASNAASKLLDLQVGGVSQCSVDKAGRLYALAFSPNTGSTHYFDATLSNFRGATGVRIDNQLQFSTDVIVRRDAANTLALRNSTNAQAFNVYNTYTDASNYERCGMRWSGNDFIIGMQGAGTGSPSRQLHFGAVSYRFYVGSGASTVAWYLNSDGSLTYEGTASGFIGMKEQTAPSAPAANGVRIYAEDDGTGKTRLMARFGTGAAQQIAIEP